MFLWAEWTFYLGRIPVDSLVQHSRTFLHQNPKETEMTRSSRIARTASRIRRVHSEISLANRRMFELTTGVPTARRPRSSRH